ncbi:cytochrome c oxidase assembly protein [Motilimonas pumila]|uniref:Cytochrome c oxidase assembly protein CtaG n=1 Tax=Motilimonas pumila TaxID=2303987 RepID=A0A418YHR2_9GAMM|nr:cytochrome c oxidase assembly protein [Motilimonas pumila]RJG49499.1 cytochrome c oxidase assembly protein [Motilimonas pumila]
MAQTKPLVWTLSAVVVAMFGFGFALVPLYQVFCEITGLNGKTATSASVKPADYVDRNRTVTVEFITYLSPGMQWQFKPEVQTMKVHPGEIHQVNFIAHNQAGSAQVGQAVPSVSPGQAAAYLNKTECFCFNQQPLQAGERAELPLRFFVDNALPAEVKTLTLSYTLYDISASDSAG